MQRKTKHATSPARARRGGGPLEVEELRGVDPRSESESQGETDDDTRSPPPPPPPQPGARWRTWAVRTPTTLAMIFGFLFLLWLGHWACVALIVFLEAAVFRETMGIASRGNRERAAPSTSAFINWSLFILAVSYFMVRQLGTSFHDQLMAIDDVQMYYSRHSFIFFCLYLAVFVAFVASLEKGKYKAQFVQLAWSHMIVFFVVIQCSFWIKNTFDGLIWLMLPSSMVINNDIFAFIFGFFFGKTPLIKLSPKKTWEGFIGGALATFVWAWFFAALLAKSQFLICPKTDLYAWGEVCEPNPVFLPHDYDTPSWLVPVIGNRTFTFLPIQFHALALAAFSSSVAPFGGFFASGVKRAFKLKDFADKIPGHGGVTDRMDCQFLMGTFTSLYLTTFIMTPDPVSKIMTSIAKLSPVQQLELLERLKHFMSAKGIALP
eukprot:m51a1_g697 putative phosphatidate cytidylyltransferase (434) ;mRNA; f:366703-368422